MVFFAVGDPAYAAPAQGLGEDDNAGATRGSRYLSYFVPLPETRDEITRIAGLFDQGSVKTLFGAEATESNVRNANLSSYRFLHFGTHGILGREVPGVLEPAIVLANEPGQEAS